jgi:hypothetical protein
LSSYYHQIELDSGSRFLTGFITEDGIFEYQRVPMGLKNACAHAQSQLQSAIDSDPILSKYGLRNYFDDLPLAAKTEDDDGSSPAAVGWPPTARAGATASRILTVIPFKLNYPILINIPILSFILRTLTGHSFETPK